MHLPNLICVIVVCESNERSEYTYVGLADFLKVMNVVSTLI